MKKLLIVLTSIIFLSLSACVQINGDENTKEIRTSRCNYTVLIDNNELNEDYTIIEISITISFNEDMTITLPTSSYGKDAVVEMIAVNDENETINLYNNRFGVIVNEQMYIVDFEDGETLDIIFTFSSIDSSILKTEYIAEAGTYSVKLKLIDEDGWIDTELDIIVT